MQVQYRNCNYIGEFNPQNYERHGNGLLIFDNSQIIMAKWKSNFIHGSFVLITDRMRALGTMINNMLQGYNVISLQQSLVSNKKQTQRTIYGMFKQNKLYGKALIIDGDQMVIAHYTDGKLRQISQKKPNRDQQVYNALKTHFPNQVYTIAEWLLQIFNKASRQFNFDNSYKYEPVIRKFQQSTFFYGYAETFMKDNGFGFVMHQGEIISIGDHCKDYLQGIGRLYRSDRTVEDGVFKQGELCGIGISYSKKNHKFILGQHNQQNESFQKGFGFPQKQINQIRKQFHLRSIYFYNDIILFTFTTLFQAICSNCLQYGIQHESPRFSSINNNYQNDQKKRGLPQKSPLRAKIAQYQQQSQRIDDPSPIKNKPNNQYEKLDHKRSNYFYNDEIKEPQEYPRQKSKSNSKSNSRRNFQPLNKGRQPSDTSSRNTNKKVKDTRQLVRQLQQKQRMKRGYLDQIYKQAKLYSRKN